MYVLRKLDKDKEHIKELDLKWKAIGVNCSFHLNSYFAALYLDVTGDIHQVQFCSRGFFFVMLLHIYHYFRCTKFWVFSSPLYNIYIYIYKYIYMIYALNFGFFLKECTKGSSAGGY